MKDRKLYNIKTTLKALPGDRVMASNYKSKSAPWEPGVVYDMKISVGADAKLYPIYRVALDRKSPKGNVLILHVGDSGIQRLETR